MLVGVEAASADNDFTAASPYHIIHVEPNSIYKSDLGLAVAMASATSGAGGRWPEAGIPLG
ncbi:hypothetical protein E2562_016356 [Oryza meyeriana var. granulata]|uniref:Uncharacterized protein n=1 Tax=Oryza meyeriana var. granulata TaxID=110450 RepID=A0A6G1DX38_9ORYZ|nr:hypothetical protein E2562_016356 [Oryza meyeriana var. granulata]